MRTIRRLTAIIVLTLAAAPLFAANEDGSAVTVLDGGRTLVPIRTVTEWLGANVQYDPPTRQITITRGSTTLNLRPGSQAASIDGTALKLDVPPLVLAGITYVPARFVAEAFGADVNQQGHGPLELSHARRSMTLRTVVRKGDRLTYRGPWFDIDYPASFRPTGFDHAPNAEGYDQDGMRFLSPDGQVEFYVYSPQWSGDPNWPTVWPGETITNRNTGIEGSGVGEKRMSWITVEGSGYARSWVEVLEGPSVKYFFGLKYDTRAAYDRWKPEYFTFRDSLVQYADGLGADG